MHPTSPHYRAALAIARTLREAGHQAYFAGGCVRDLLLGLEPKDYDVATSATPDQIVALFPKTFTVGAHFGVVLVCEEVGRAGHRHRSRHLPLRRRLLRRPPARCRALHHRPARRRPPPRLHHQRHAARSHRLRSHRRSRLRRARLRRRSRRPAPRRRPRHRRPQAPLRRRQAAPAARRPLRRAPQLPPRRRRHPLQGRRHHAGLSRAHLATS